MNPSKLPQPVVRMAPSPTGWLHLGTARAALYNFLFARKLGGTFILRIEDTDAERSKKEYEDDILEQLTWLKLSWDALYRQSERRELYRSELQRLIAADTAYVSREPSKVEGGGEVEVVRLRNPGAEITFTDIIHGEIRFDTTELGDFVIARSTDDPLYHFAVVVDDAHMGITHVIRGEDHISNTPRHILIQEALGFSRPVYAHIPLILAPDRSKLSKRKGSTSVRDYRAFGYPPEALVNHLAFLGWSPSSGQECFTLPELVESFDLARVHRAGAIFDVEKLNWFSRQHLARLAPERLLVEIEAWLPERVRALPQYSPERLMRALRSLRERMVRFGDITALAEAGELDYYFAAPSLGLAGLSQHGKIPVVDVREHLTTVSEALENVSPEQFGAETVKAALWDYATEVGRGAVLWPLRFALSGKEKSPDPFTLSEILGREETLRRVGAARNTALSEA